MRHASQEVGIKVRPVFQACSKRIQSAFARIGSLQYDIDKLGFELGLLEHAGDFEVGHLILDFRDAAGACDSFRRERNRTTGFEIEMVFEIVVGVVKDHEVFPFRRLQRFGEIAFERFNPLCESSGILLVGCRIIRIEF